MSTRIATVGELAPGQTKKFLLQCGPREIPGFLVNLDGTLHAYVNRCRHVPMEMDWVENRFFTEDGRYVQCATHGALYEPTTGECIAGPACGKSLHRLTLHIEGDDVRCDCPGPLPDDA